MSTLFGINWAGYYNPTTNLPILQNGVGQPGTFYISTQSATINLGSGNLVFEVGYWALLNSNLIWQAVPVASSGSIGGIVSINGDTTAAQTITGTAPMSASTTSGTTTIAVANATATTVGVSHYPATGALTITSGAVAVNVDGTSIIINGSNQLECIVSPSTTNTLTSSVNTMTSTVNGVAASAPIVNTVALSYNGSLQLESTVNGVAATPLTQTWMVGLPNIQVANYTVLDTDSLVYANASNITLSLPTYASAIQGHPFTFKIGNVANVTIQTTDGTNIDGVQNLILSYYDAMILIPINGNWAIIDLYAPAQVTGALLAYAVTTGAGYPANGQLLVPYGTTTGLLLGNASGNSYESTLQNGTVATGTVLYQTVTTGQGYPDNGMLVLSSSTVAGDAVFLIGNAGSCYTLAWDGVTHATTTAEITAVTVGGVYPVSGVLLNSSTAASGYGALLFGSNGILYDIVLP